MSALETAALMAEEEAAGLRLAAIHAMCLEDQSDIHYDMATDAIDAYNRARERARMARRLADHASGSYNVWHGQSAGAQ
jgi:hypothetical protein